MSDERVPQYHPISMLPVIRDLIDGGLADITSNLANIKAIHAREHGTLDEHTAARFVALFAEGLEFVPVYTEQLARWHRLTLSDAERKEVTRLQQQMVPLRAAARDSPSPMR
jgi:hypothetical protein